METSKPYTVFEAIKADVWRYHGRYSFPLLLGTWFVHRTFRPVLTLRLCHATRKIPGPLRAIVFPPLLIAHRWMQAGASIDLPWKVSVGPGFRITHGWGLVVHDDAVIGRNVTVFHGVTIGSKRKGERLVAPRIGNSVTIAAGAIVIGDVYIGDGAIVGAGAVVVKDVAACSAVANESCREIRTGIEPRVSFPALSI